MSKKTSKFLSKGKKKSADFDFAALENNLDKKTKNLENYTEQSNKNPNLNSNANSNLSRSEEIKNEEQYFQNNSADLSQKIDFIKTQKTQFEEQNEGQDEGQSQNQKTLFNFDRKNYSEVYKKLENSTANINQSNSKFNQEIEAKKFDIFNFLKPRGKLKEIEKIDSPHIIQKSEDKFSQKKIEELEEVKPNFVQKDELNSSDSSNLPSNLELFDLEKNTEKKFNSSSQNNFDSVKKMPNNSIQLVNFEPNLDQKKSQINEKIPKPKTFKGNIGDGELRLLLTTHSFQEEIDQHLAPKDEYENVLLTNNSNNEKNEFELGDLREGKNQANLQGNYDEFTEFENKNNQNKKQNINQFGLKSNKNYQQNNLPENTSNQSSGKNYQKLSKNSENSENSGFIENSEDKAKFVVAKQNYQKEQKKSQFNLILKIIAFGCLLAVLLFYFQGLQPLILSQVTQKNQEKIIKLSQIFQSQVGSYFEITQDLNAKIQPDSDQKCTQNYTDSEMSKDSQKIEDLINNKLKISKNMENAEKYWNFNSSEIEKEYLQTLSRYQQSLEIYRKKSDYLVDYLYFLLQRNSWQEICQNIKKTDSLNKFEEICGDWKNLNEKYKIRRKSEFFGNIETVITSFDTNCNELNNTNPSKWRENWLEKYTILIKILPNNDNSRLYQMNEQTLTEFQTRSRNIWTIYQQKTSGISSLYFLNLEK